MTTNRNAGNVGPAWTWGDRIRKVRRDIAKVSQEGMAEVIGVNVATLSSWEGNRAQPYLRLAERIARRVEELFPDKVSAAWLLGQGADDPVPVERPVQARASGEPTYVDLTELAWLPRMDSNHQPPDCCPRAGQRAGCGHVSPIAMSYRSERRHTSPSVKKLSNSFRRQVKDLASETFQKSTDVIKTPANLTPQDLGSLEP
jgi:DNA-binding XRE family transcriptional regulator